MTKLHLLFTTVAVVLGLASAADSPANAGSDLARADSVILAQSCLSLQQSLGTSVGSPLPGSENPASLIARYGVPPGTGHAAIAIVEPYDDGPALPDFNRYAGFVGAPIEPSSNAYSPANKVFQVVYANGLQPASDTGWNLNASLCIEQAHALAPKAKIILIEAASSSLADLIHAVDVAGSLPRVEEIVMPWTVAEFSGEGQLDSHFLEPGVAYFAASGCGGAAVGVGYPSASPNVVGTGGTAINRSRSGSFISETGWSGSGGGKSTQEPLPPYQSGIQIAGARRAVPDIAADADPASGVAIFFHGAWLPYQAAGTALPAALIAAMVNASGSHAGSSGAELTRLYSEIGSADFFDIVQGSNGYSCVPGYDFVTGVGAPNGIGGL